MPDDRRSVSSKIRKFLALPFHGKTNALQAVLIVGKGRFYYRRFFGNFGSRTLLFKPERLVNPRFLHIGDRTMIGHGAHIEIISEYANVQYSPKVEIGSNVYIGPHLYMVCVGRVSIGDRSVLSEHVYIHDNNHGFDPTHGPIMQQKLVHSGDITIGKDCFLGYRTAILPGVTLGDHCVVGTGAVVTKSFPSFSMIAGVPAILLKRYSFEEEAWVRVG